MQVIVCEEPGRLAFKEQQKPEIKEGIGICGTDLHLQVWQTQLLSKNQCLWRTC